MSRGLDRSSIATHVKLMRGARAGTKSGTGRPEFLQAKEPHGEHGSQRVVSYPTIFLNSPLPGSAPGLIN